MKRFVGSRCVLWLFLLFYHDIQPSNCFSFSSYTSTTARWIRESLWRKHGRGTSYPLTNFPIHEVRHPNRRTTQHSGITRITASNQKQIEHEATENLRNRQEAAFIDSLSCDTSNTLESEKPTDNNTLDHRLQGILVLLTVPIAWGTYAPVVKYVYQLQAPVPGLVFSAAYYAVASATLLGILAFQKSIKNTGNQEVESSLMQLDTTNYEAPEQKSSSSLPVQVQGGLELGSYLVMGNTLQVIGLQSVPADRAAFLVQLTTIMVPLLQAFFARNLLSISTRTWLACFVAFAGVIAMEFDGTNAVSDLNAVQSPTNSFSYMPFLETGDALIVLSAVAYSFHVLRLDKYANQVKPLTLASSKATVEAVFTIFLVLALLLMDPTSNTLSKEIVDFCDAIFSGSVLLSSQQSLQVVGAVLWTGIITCAYAIYAQSFGQRRVSPTDANLIYSSQPIFSAIFAFWFLGEKLGTLGFIGGALISSAMYLVSSSAGGANQQDVSKS